ncbi:MAG: hypothetical protein K0M50_02755 [Prolixibacteraceae bacterium]|nr:hypothetical protein [Prolixibacteraceae bacterium]
MTIRQKVKPRQIIIIATALILFMFGGIFAGISGVWKMVNYHHPYLFGFIFGGIGWIFGLFTYYKLFIAHKAKNLFDEFPALLCISIGFIGLFLFLSPVLNQELSVNKKCDNYIVIQKDKNVSSARNPKIFSLYVKINDKSYRLICSSDYWNNVSIGQSIDICLHKSNLGFDFFSLKDDKKKASS